MPAGISCNKAANRKGKPFMKCRVAGYRELKRTLPTRKHKLSTQATAANKAPTKKKIYIQLYNLEDRVDPFYKDLHLRQTIKEETYTHTISIHYSLCP